MMSGAIIPGRVSQGTLVIVTKEEDVILPRLRRLGPHPGARPGVGARKQVPYYSRPEIIWICSPVGPPPVQGAMKVRYNVDQVAVKGRGLDGLTINYHIALG